MGFISIRAYRLLRAAGETETMQGNIHKRLSWREETLVFSF
jgi:hypothetical protein